MIDVNNLCNGCMREMKPDEAVCSFCGWNRNTPDERTAKCLPKETILNGRYLIGRVLGEGGFGVTYLAMDLATETRVAIKEYFPVGLASRDFSVNGSTYLSIMSGEAGQHYKRGLNSFADEGQILSGFGNLPGIVDAKDFFFENNTAYLVMEYVEGQSLKEHMRQRRQENQVGMDYRVAIALLEPVMASLVEIHKKHLMHRDISPDNIIMGSDGNVKLIDFGAARADMGNSERSLTVMVKHGYAPEEQYRSHGKQGAWTDVYALCATLYHMISGTLPEDGVERLYQDRVASLSSFNFEVPVPQEVSDVIAKGMAVRAENRYQSMSELHFALTQAQAIQTAREQAEAEEAERQRLIAEQEAEDQALAEEKRKEEEAARKEVGRWYEVEQRKEREKAEAERRRQEIEQIEEEKNHKKAMIQACIFIFLFVFFIVLAVMPKKANAIQSNSEFDISSVVDSSDVSEAAREIRDIIETVVQNAWRENPDDNLKFGDSYIENYTSDYVLIEMPAEIKRPKSDMLKISEIGSYIGFEINTDNENDSGGYVNFSICFDGFFERFDEEAFGNAFAKTMGDKFTVYKVKDEEGEVHGIQLTDKDYDIDNIYIDYNKWAEPDDYCYNRLDISFYNLKPENEPKFEHTADIEELLSNTVKKMQNKHVDTSCMYSFRDVTLFTGRDYYVCKCDGDNYAEIVSSPDPEKLFGLEEKDDVVYLAFDSEQNLILASPEESKARAYGDTVYKLWCCSIHSVSDSNNELWKKFEYRLSPVE